VKNTPKQNTLSNFYSSEGLITESSHLFPAAVLNSGQMAMRLPARIRPPPIKC
jgi:hypothetical protein